MITTPKIRQNIFNAFLLFFFFIWPSNKIGMTNQMHKPKITDIIINIQLNNYTHSFQILIGKAIQKAIN